MRTHTIALAFAALSLWLALPAFAQGEANIELGATQASDVELNAGSGTSRSRTSASSRGGDGLRLGLQLRLNAVNVLEMSDVVGNDISDTAQVPFVTPGVRLMGGKLFLGMGLGFNSVSVEQENGDEESRSGFTFSPLAGYDIVTDGAAALSLLGWLNLSSLGETEECDGGGCMDLNNDAFGWGLNFGLGLRGFISEGLAIGGEFGWGFLNVSADNGADAFAHGVFGNLVFDASVGL